MPPTLPVDVGVTVTEAVSRLPTPKKNAWHGAEKGCVFELSQSWLVGAEA